MEPEGSQEPATGFILSQRNPIHTIALSFLVSSVLILSFHLCLCLAWGCFTSDFL